MRRVRPPAPRGPTLAQVIQRAREFCPLAKDDEDYLYHEFARRNHFQADDQGPRPARWDTKAHLIGPLPMSADLANPADACALVLNHWRARNGRPWLQWDGVALYGRACALSAYAEPDDDPRHDPDSDAYDEDAEPIDDGRQFDAQGERYPRLVTMRDYMAALAAGVGPGVDPWAEGEATHDDTAIESPRRITTLDGIAAAIRYVGPVLLALDFHREFYHPQGAGIDHLIHTPGSGLLAGPSPCVGRMVLVAYRFDDRGLRFRARSTLGAGYARGGDVDVSYHEIERQFAAGRLDAWLLSVREMV